jgi:hypothetical protein
METRPTGVSNFRREDAGETVLSSALGFSSDFSLFEKTVFTTVPYVTA